MKYIFKSNINKDEFDLFVKNFDSTNFMQISPWANIKSSWNSDLVGMYENEKLVCSALILKRKLLLNKYLFYIPRGFVIDYKNYDLLSSFVSELKKYAKENNAIEIKIDPFICFNEDNILTIKNNKEVKTRNTFTKNTKEIISNLEKAGFKHGGFGKKVNSYIQARYTMAISLKDENEVMYNKETLKRRIPKHTRKYIGTYQEKRGVSFSFSKNTDDIKKLTNTLKCTEKRQHISLRNENYFKTMMENYPNDAVLFFANVDIDKYINFLNKDMKENPEKGEFNKNQITEANKIKEKYGNNPLAGTAIVMMPTNEKGNKVASFLYAGTNTEILPSLKITNGLMFYRLCYCLDKGCDYCDLGGVDGSLKDRLSAFKSKFNPQVLELVGEYDLVINKFYFIMFKSDMKIHRLISKTKTIGKDALQSLLSSE